MGINVFFYVQHLLGVGHLARASRIAHALQAGGADVTLAVGGMPVAGFPGEGLKTVALPPVRSADEGFSGLVDTDGRAVDEPFMAERRRRLIAAFEAARPDALIIEAYPFGRRQMAFELKPLIERAEAMTSRPLVATSLRDIQQENRKPGRVEEMAGLILRHFDLVLVHGDPAFARLDETFPLAGAIADRVRYTGLVAAAPAAPAAEAFDVIVSAGGGAAGRGLLGAAAEAARLLPPDLRLLLITGPNLPASERAALAASVPPSVTVEAFRADFRALLMSARLSVSQSGYNTACDLLQAGCRRLFVPFAAGGETEQTQRAERLSALGLARVITERDLDGSSLAAAITAALDGPPPPPHGFDLDGGRRTAELVAAAVAARRGA
jgi:predicted glycosyltransferase